MADFAGAIGYANLAQAVQNGYAAASTDTGHHAGGTDATWATDHPEKLIDFGWRAVHLTAVTSKVLTAAFYGTPRPRHSYFESCSNGGRQGLMEAQRFPEDYDGIIAGAPAYDWTRLFTDFVWNAQALAAPGAMIPAAKTPAIARAVLAQCDAQDGLTDGLVSAPRLCRFDPERLKCTDKDSRRVFDGSRESTRASGNLSRCSRLEGQADLFRVSSRRRDCARLGGMGCVDFWSRARREHPERFRQQLRQVHGGCARRLDTADFNFDRDFAPLEARNGGHLQCHQPGFITLRGSRGKLILFHGWSDAAVTALGTVDYRNKVVARMGEKQSGAFMRLFMVPGMHHCGGGTGPEATSVKAAFLRSNRHPRHTAAALAEAWVEQGRAPEKVIARQSPQFGTPKVQPVRTGLICAYPKRAMLKSGSDPQVAESYVCGDPRAR